MVLHAVYIDSLPFLTVAVLVHTKLNPLCSLSIFDVTHTRKDNRHSFMHP